MDYQQIEDTLNAGYRLATAEYRRDDEIEVTTENHRRLGRALRQICLSFPQPIEVLEAGCGTGRYFHCLQNVVRLVGLDISEEMLAAARSPVCADQVAVGRIELVRGNVYLASFPPASFHFIYSLGMFGHGCPVTVEVCNRFFEWLKPGGILFFNAVDTAGLPAWYRARRRLRALAYPLLPRQLQRALDERENRSPLFALTKGELLETLSGSRFAEFAVASQVCLSPLWSGRHLECLATKEPGP